MKRADVVTSETARPVAGVAGPVASLPKTRRRPWLAVVGAVLMVAAALASVLIYQSVGSTKAVVAVRQNVMRGAEITRADLTTIRSGGELAAGAVPASQIDSVVGQHAALDIAAGTPVLRSQLTATTLTEGQSLVGVAVSTSQAPAGIRPGDRVRLVLGAGAQGDTGPQQASAAPVTPIKGTVISVGGPDVGGRIPIVVQVAETDASPLATAAAAGRVAIVVDSPQRKG